MRKLVKIAGIATLVVILAAGVVGAVALAQEGSEDGEGWNLRERMHQAIAGILGISVERYESAIEEAEDSVLEDAMVEGWLTQEQADQLAERMDLVPPEGRMGFPFHGKRGGWGMRGDSLYSVAAEQLDLTLPELMEELSDGSSIADVAAEKGVDPQAIADAYLAQLEGTLTEAVENERITQKQADSVLEKAAEDVTAQLEAACGSCGRVGHIGPGGRMGTFHRFPGGKGTGWGPF